MTASQLCIFFLLFFPFFLYLIKIYLLIHLSIMSLTPFIHDLPLSYHQFVSFLALTQYLGFGLIFCKCLCNQPVKVEPSSSWLPYIPKPANIPLAQHRDCWFRSICQRQSFSARQRTNLPADKENDAGNGRGSKSQCLLLFPKHVPTE